MDCGAVLFTKYEVISMLHFRETQSFNPEPIAIDRLAAAKMLGISTATLDRHVRAGTIPHRKLGRRVLFDRKTIENWLRSEPDA